MFYLFVLVLLLLLFLVVLFCYGRFCCFFFASAPVCLSPCQSFQGQQGKPAPGKVNQRTNTGSLVPVGQSGGGEDTGSCWLIKFIHNLNSGLLTLGITSCAVIVVVKRAPGSFS